MKESTYPPDEKTADELRAEIRRLNEELKRARQAQTIAQDGQFAEMLSRYSHDLVCLHDLEGRIVALNDAGRLMLGVQEGQELYIRDITPSYIHEDFPRIITRLQSEKAGHGQLPVFDHAGEIRQLSYHHRLVGEGPEALVQVVAHDITELWRSQLLLENSYEDLRDIFQSSGDAILVLNDEGKILSINQAALDLYGYAEDQLVGQSYQMLHVRSYYDADRVRELLQRAMNGETARMDWDGQTRQDEQLLREVTFRRGSWGGRTVVIAFDREIPEWKRVERNIAQRNKELEYINEILKFASSELQAERFLLKSLRKTLSLTGIKAGGVYWIDQEAEQGRLVGQYHMEPDEEAALQQLDLKNKTFQQLRRYHRNVVTTSPVDPDKRLLYFPIETEGQLRAVLVFRRMLERVRREEILLLNFISKELGNYLTHERLQGQLTNYEERYKLLFESANDGILLLEDGVVVDCNQRASEIFGDVTDEMIGMPYLSLLPERQPDGALSSDLVASRFQTVRKGLSFSFEGQHQRLDGELIDTEITLNSLETPDNFLMVAIIRNITDRKQAEVALKESEAKFRTLADNAPVLMKMTNANNYFNFFSRQWLTFTGYTSEQALENGWLDNLHPDDLPNFLVTLDRAFKRRGSFEINYRLKRADGTYRWMLDNGVPYVDNQGQFRGYISCAVDITDRRAAEEEARRQEALIESEKRLHNVLAKATLVALNLDQEGQLFYANHYFQTITDWQEDELKARNWFDLIPPDQREQAVADLKQLFESGGLMQNFEQEILTRNGEVRVVRFNTIILNNAADGQLRATVVGEDITEKLRVAKALEESTRQLQDFFENANDLIMIFAPDGTLRTGNTAFRATLGYTEDEAKQLHFSQLIHPEHREQIERYLKSLLKGGATERFETVLLTHDGKNINVMASINCQFQNGRPMAFRVIMHDITERTRAERSQRLYHTIAGLTVQSPNLRDLYANIQQELGQAVDTNNFSIVLTNPEGDGLQFAFFQDEHGDDDPYPAERRQMAEWLAYQVMQQEQPLFLYEGRLVGLAREAGVSLPKPVPKVWLGVPLRLGSTLTGVIAIYSYYDRTAYDRKDLKLLDFISGQVALSIQRKKDEEMLSDQTARLNAIFESSSHLIWSVNRQGRLTSFNSNYGVTLGQEGTQHSIPMDHWFSTWLSQYQQVFDGRPLNFETSQTVRNEELWWEIFLNPIYKSDGQIEEISGIGHDITQKKISGLALKESEEKFRNIFESFQDIYFRTDQEGYITMISPSVQELCGYEPEEVMGKKVTEFYVYNVRRRDSLRQLTRKGSIRNFEVPIIDKRGEVIQFICNMRLIRNEQNKVVGVEGVARDITELKKANQEVMDARDLAERSLKVKEQFLANMSHEIRTPMNGVIGVIDLLNDTPLNTEQRDYVQTVKKSSETLLNILNDILDISKIEAGKMQLRRHPLSLFDTIDKLISLFQQQASQKGIRLHYQVADEVPRYISADETRLLQVLSNLTSNAIKFTDKGEVRLTFTGQVLPAQGNDPQRKHLIRVEVTDTGIGISRENLSALFDYFAQLDNSSTKSYAGTGLGLVISKQLSHLMNGDIGVKSEKGKGSTFWFTFQTREVEAAQVPSRDSEHAVAVRYQFLEPPRVLLVDDNPINRKVASEILRKAGCDVVTASNGAEALATVGNDSFELIFMDIQMPDMDGVTAMKKLREQHKQLPPIIAMTAYSMQGDEDKFIQSGMDDYLSKPIKPETLVMMVKEWVKKPTKVLKGPAEAPEASAGTVLNLEKVKNLLRIIGEEMTQETYQEFETETQQFLHECQEATAREEYNVVKSHLHTLKGNAGTLGVEKLAEQARLTEEKLKTGNYISLQQDLIYLEEKFREYQDLYPNLLNTISP
ncbi:PAS domain S-box-containing protein [Catalinimonas alkaloidigena]|uniref:Sensory/regulatory protein RpfC n=1 Tax=Catalinimonas alkaloidigena TaxID=1075417 RepID=A0A1G9GTN4_9BACT|nr:PAS domain S-box protein [Catalinimonas alkaloidigena]SDL03643.1 PAS domain S-box-containing protein [Catalinimonas alkaloidigena]